MKRDSRVSFYTLLQLLAIFEGIIIAFLSGDGTFVNSSTKVISIALCVIVLFLLSDAKRNNNQPLTVMSWWLVFFVILRVITLHYTNYSVCLQRSGADTNGVNSTLLFICGGTIMLWCGMHHIKKKNIILNNHFYTATENSINRGVILYSISLIFNLIVVFSLPFASLASIINSFVLNIQCILFVLAIIALLSWRQLSSSSKWKMIIVFFSYITFLTVGGSRSGIITIIRILLFIILALNITRIKRVYIYILLILTPFMFFVFGYTTYMRQMNLRYASIDEKVLLVSEYISHSKGEDAVTLLAPVFDRVGFLDFAVEMNVRKDQLKRYINIPNEIKSIIDNALTPGFDFFDAPRMSNVIHNTYNYRGDNQLFSKSKNMSRGYHSDELTLYGESILLFGIPIGLFFLFMVGVLVRKVWLYGSGRSDITGLFIKGICLYLFEKMLSSFGFDWLALDMVSFIITYIIFSSYVFETKKLRKKD